MNTRKVFGYGMLAVILALAITACTNPAGAEKKNTDTVITNAAVTITGPATGSAPVTAAATTVTGYTCGAVSWSPNDNTFKGSTAYTATVTLTAKEGYTFNGLTTATINAQNAAVANNTGAAVTLSFAFAATSAKAVTGISIKTQPTKLTYTDGETLDLSGLVVTVTHDDNTSEDVALDDFASKNISATPANGTTLSPTTHNAQPVVVSYGEETANTNNLTVAAKANPSVTWPTAAAITYGAALSTSALSGGSGDGAFAWTNGAIIPTVTNSGYEVTFTPTDTAKYNTLTQNVGITVNKATPDVTWPTGLTVTYGQILSNIALPGSGTSVPAGAFTWTTPNTSVDSLGTQSYNMTFTPTDTANYSTATSDVNIRVLLGVEMVSVGAGSFQMGKNGDGTANSVTPVHEVTLAAFSIGKYELTQAQYEAVMGTTIEQQNEISDYQGLDGVGDDYPMYHVSWYDALVFCNKLSVLEGLTPAYSIDGETDPDEWGTVPRNSDATWNAVEIVTDSNGYRLPTEAQWEYAAKGGPSASDPYKIYSGSDTVGDVAWYWDNIPSQTSGETGYGAQQVGTKAANELGIHDMSGNVWEWCWDWYAAYEDEAQTDPVGASSGSGRVIRGGGWIDSAEFARSPYRGDGGPNARGYALGFRLLRP